MLNVIMVRQWYSSDHVCDDGSNREGVESVCMVG